VAIRKRLNTVYDYRPPWARAGGGCDGHRSCRFRRPAPLAVQVLRPAAAAVGEVLAVGDQALVQVAGEYRDAVGAGVVPEEVAGHAHLAAAAGEQHRLIEPGPALDRLLAGGAQTCGRDGGHGDFLMRTSVLAEVRGIAPGALSVPFSRGRQRPTISSQQPPPRQRVLRVSPGARATRVRRCRTLALG
jgi:hypothetical protein